MGYFGDIIAPVITYCSGEFWKSPEQDLCHFLKMGGKGAKRGEKLRFWGQVTF